jgi:hypothetical protein
MSSFCKTCGAEISDDDSGFDAFWRAYPKKADKVVAFKSWKKLRAADRLAVMNDLPRRILTWNLKGWQLGGDFRPSPPNPSTYLNKRRWEDEISVPAIVKSKMDGGLARRSVDEVFRGVVEAENTAGRACGGVPAPIQASASNSPQRGASPLPPTDPDLLQTPAQRRANMARLGSILDGLGKIF